MVFWKIVVFVIGFIGLVVFGLIMFFIIIWFYFVEDVGWIVMF